MLQTKTLNQLLNKRRTHVRRMEMRQDMYEKARTNPSFKENQKIEEKYRTARFWMSHLIVTVCGLTVGLAQLPKHTW